MATAVATIEQNRPQTPATPEGAHFALMQRKAAIYSRSPLIPDTLRAGGPEAALANCYIALSIAERMGENELTVLQNIHIVKGKAGFSAQFMIARANASGVFKGRIGWREEGRGDSLSITAYATLADTGEEVSFTVDMSMAKAEGWTSNPKYKSVPHLMLRYRSATFLVRLYAPDVMFGYRSTDEVEDMSFAEGAVVGTAQPLTAAMIEHQAETPVEPNDGTLSAENPTAQEGRADEDHGDQQDGTLTAAKAEIADASNVMDVNSRVSRLRKAHPDHADAIMQAGTDRIAELSA